MKRLLLLACLVVSATNPISAIDPVGNLVGFGLNQSPAYPILPSKSVILGGSIQPCRMNRPYIRFNRDLIGGSACLDLNCSPELSGMRYSSIKANPGWETGLPQGISLVESSDGTKYLAGSNTQVYQDKGFIISQSLKGDVWVGTAYTLEMKRVLQVTSQTGNLTMLYPLSKKRFMFRDKMIKVIDTSGNVIVEGYTISSCLDPWDRFIFLDGRLFDLERKEFVQLPIDLFGGFHSFRFCEDYLEVVRQCDASPPMKDCVPRIWRFNYRWELAQEFDVVNPINSPYANCHGIVGDVMLFFDRSSTDKCGWHFVDIKTNEAKLHLPCLGFADIASNYQLKDGRMAVPNPDGAWCVDLGTMRVDKLCFPGRSSILKTDRGLFAITEDSGEQYASGHLLDLNLKRIESTKTSLQKAQSYLVQKDRILSLSHECNTFYDEVSKRHMNEYILSIWCSLLGEGKPKRLGVYKFTSVFKSLGAIDHSVSDNVLHIPTGTAGFVSIDLLSMKMRKHNNDELDFRYKGKLPSPPRLVKTKMMTAFVYDKAMVFAYDQWMNLKMELSIKPENTWNNQKTWVWWDKVIVAGADKATIYRMDGSVKTLEGAAVSFNNGHLQMLVGNEAHKPQRLVGIDIDTDYERTIWSKLGDDKIGSPFNSIGNDFHIGDKVFDMHGSLVQTGISGLQSLDVESGSSLMACSENGIKGCGSDFFVTKWTPAPHYSIKRVYKNEFEIKSARGDGKAEPLSGTVFACKWGDDGNAPLATRLYEVAQISNMKYSDTKRFRVRFPQSVFLADAQKGNACFALVFIGNGLLDLEKSELEENEYAGRALFDGTPVDAINQRAVSVTVWKEQP